MWSYQTLGLDQTVFNVLETIIIVIAVLVVLSVVFFARRNRIRRRILRYPSQGKIAALTILAVILVTIGVIVFFPFSEIGLSFPEINLVMQTFWTGLILVSMWVRFKGNYFVHEITMLIAICALLVSFSAVLFMGPLTSSPAFSSSHGIFSIPALVFGVWLVALWRPGSSSASFATKSGRIAKLTIIFWVPSYVVGVLDFMLLHTAFFG
jgi:uncharacterized membrane protein YozB (DUF420 family)